MEIQITKVTSWTDVLNAARFTQRKEPLDKEPSETINRLRKAIEKYETNRK